MLKPFLLGMVLAGAGVCFAPTTHAQEAKSAEQSAQKGGAAPDFTVTGIDGKQFKLSDRLKRDKNIVLMFSRASW